MIKKIWPILFLASVHAATTPPVSDCPVPQLPDKFTAIRGVDSNYMKFTDSASGESLGKIRIRYKFFYGGYIYQYIGSDGKTLAIGKQKNRQDQMVEVLDCDKKKIGTISRNDKTLLVDGQVIAKFQIKDVPMNLDIAYEDNMAMDALLSLANAFSDHFYVKIGMRAFELSDDSGLIATFADAQTTGEIVSKAVIFDVLEHHIVDPRLLIMLAIL